MIRKAAAGFVCAILLCSPALAKQKAPVAQPISAEEATRTLQQMGAFGGAEIKFIKSADTSAPDWKVHLFTVTQEGLVLPVAAYVNSRDISVGILVHDGKIVIPKVPLEELQPSMKMSNVPITIEKRKIFNADTGRDLMFVFVDPDCPYCRELEAKLQQYHGRYKVVMKHFPMEQMHPGAREKAAEKQCLWVKETCDSAESIVQEDIKEGNTLGVYGTPLFIDGKGTPLDKIPDLD